MVKGIRVDSHVVALQRPTRSQVIVTATFFGGGLPWTTHMIAVLQPAARRYHCPVGPIAARFTEPILRGLI
jgi:hypothetical protein